MDSPRSSSPATLASILFSPLGEEALRAAMAEADPDSLGAADRLRRSYPGDLAAVALDQASLRRRGRTKFGERAARMWFTHAGLEQASRPVVAAWRAARLADAGVTRAIDLGCGIGADARALLDAGLEVTAVEIDPFVAACAERNLGRPVIVGDAAALAPALLAGAGPETVAFVDPARRNDAGRLWRLEDFSPEWSMVRPLLAAPHATVVKLGPGMPKQLLPEGLEACWVSDRGDVVEVGLWHLPGRDRPARAAVLLPGGDRIAAASQPRRLPVQPPGRYLLEPDGAVIRAGALTEIAPGTDLWQLAEDVAYLSTDTPLTSPFATTFEIIETLDADERTLRAWVREHRVGVLEIKKRGIDLDPAALRRRLKPDGPASATIILARTPAGVRALVARRLRDGSRVAD